MGPGERNFSSWQCVPKRSVEPSPFHILLFPDDEARDFSMRVFLSERCYLTVASKQQGQETVTLTVRENKTIGRDPDTCTCEQS